MTREDTVKILSILKAAYPSFYKGLSKEEALAVINLWSMHLGGIPLDIISIAVSKLIATSTYPPTIAEVKSKLHGMYAEAVEELISPFVDESKIEMLEHIADTCRNVTQESSINEIIARNDRKGITDNEAHDMQQGNLPTL